MHQTIGEILKDMDLISDHEIEESLAIQKRKGGTIGEILVKLGYVTDVDVLFALAAQTGMEVVDLDDIDIEPEVISLVPNNFAETYEVIPVAHEDNTVVVAMADPLNPTMLDELRFMLSCEVRGAVSNKEAVQRALEKYYAQSLADINLLEQAGFTDDDMALLDEAGASGDIEDLERMADATPVVKLLNLILLQAIKDKAADIHLEPFENDFKVRYRIDGVLYEMMPPPAHLATALVSRVKVMASLDISERRLPQDGRIELTLGGRPVDLRVATLPTVFGESCVMRILDRSVINLDLETLGLRAPDKKLIRQLIEKPNGIVLVTGPTGSGKTTTLYSCLSEINTIDVKIITTEDPVEYNIDGLIQVAVNPDVNLTYASCLRSILRQDPDVVFVGEIRDLETASMAVEAALTGHLVLSTLHTNDAPSVATRLVDLGVEKFLLGACLEGIIAQRLVRKVCENCKTPYEPSDDELFELNLKRADVQGQTFYYGEGCKRCNSSGYKGRVAIFEMVSGSDRFKQAIIDGLTTSELGKIARAEGMKTLRESGIYAVFEGMTTIEEVVKETLVN